MGSCRADWSRNGKWHRGWTEGARYEAGDNVTAGLRGWLFHQKPQHLQASWQIRSIKSSDVRRSRLQVLVSSLNMWFGPVIYFLSHKNGAIETWTCYRLEQLCWPTAIMNKRWFWKEWSTRHTMGVISYLSLFHDRKIPCALYFWAWVVRLHL